MAKKALVIILDSVGCGEAPDAVAYGDAGADTLGHLFAGITELALPNLDSMGLAHVMRRQPTVSTLDQSSAFRLTERSAGKDTTTGHWELMDYSLDEPFYTCKEFPKDFLDELEQACGTGFIGNKAASGTEILAELGEEHLRSGRPIIYTSADSVLQIAAHEESFGLERLLDICKIARKLLDTRGLRVGRVIARPFVGEGAVNFHRTANRHDYSLTPGETVLDRIQARGVRVIGIGKISDIFAGKGICESHPTKDNADGMDVISRLWIESAHNDRFLFANLVDFDSLYGHRRDPQGYATCLMQFDAWLGGFLEKIAADDLLIITADHGNDPYHVGTDHTREQVPCLVIPSANFRVGESFDFAEVGRLVENHFTKT